MPLLSYSRHIAALPPGLQSHSGSRRGDSESSLDKKTVKVTLEKDQAGWEAILLQFLKTAICLGTWENAKLSQKARYRKVHDMLICYLL